MKRFQVENCVQNARQYAGEEPYEHISYNIVDGDVEAENEKEAIVNALYYLADNINDTNGMYAEVNLPHESILFIILSFPSFLVFIIPPIGWYVNSFFKKN